MQDLGKGEIGLGNLEEIPPGATGALPGKIGADDDRARLARGEIGPVARVGQKSDVALTRLLDGGHPPDFYPALATHAPADILGQLPQGFPPRGHFSLVPFAGARLLYN